MKKRGLNQVDWAISLGIFLLYLAWFFIFLKPQLEVSADLKPLSDIVKDKFTDDIVWQVQKYPVFVSSTKTSNNSAVFTSFIPEYGEDKFMLKDDKDYFFSNNNLLTLEDFNNNTQFYWLLESNKTYNHSNKRFDIEISSGKVTTSKQFQAEFENATLKKLSYKNKKKISNITYKINDNSLPISNNSFTNHNILAEYAVNNEPFNFYSRIIAQNSILWFYIEQLDDDTINNFIMEIEVEDFDEFFSDNNNYGDFLSDDCYSYQNDYLKFNDSSQSLNFMLPKDTQIGFCNNGDDIALNITIKIDENKEFFIISDSPSFTEADFTDYTAVTGIKSEIEGV
ncbi:hypothetical protein GOV08_05330, partial [Candidatus Woesearchaeota archaeon]|nr:hypothetical protein [Candidatus Woesearchaeota archaeon]